jgi:uncharacterized protein YjlB
VSRLIHHDVQQIMLPEEGMFPNNPVLPLLLYPGAFLPSGNNPAADIEAYFNGNDWPAAWRDGIYEFHHYHSEAHEALGVYRGDAEVQFGGPTGPVVEVKAGDVAVLPAGTAHKLIEASRDFAVVGAYPAGQDPDMCDGKQGERAGAVKRIAQVPMPRTDPVLGRTGGLVEAWGRTIPIRGSVHDT